MNLYLTLPVKSLCEREYCTTVSAANTDPSEIIYDCTSTLETTLQDPSCQDGVWQVISAELKAIVPMSGSQALAFPAIDVAAPAPDSRIAFKLLSPSASTITSKSAITPPHQDVATSINQAIVPLRAFPNYQAFAGGSPMIGVGQLALEAIQLTRAAVHIWKSIAGALLSPRRFAGYDEAVSGR
jgi:hypothetical protein